MKIAVVGLWHLGTVTAACLAGAGHDVVAFDPDTTVVEALEHGEPPVAEPGLAGLIAEGKASGRLRFTTDRGAAADCPLVWITFDTPVDADDVADSVFVTTEVEALFPWLQPGSLVLVSSQLPVGSVAALEIAFARARPGVAMGFAASPENLRLGKALEVFRQPDRVVVGTRSARDRAIVTAALAPITDRIEWMSVESAEMTKHAINGFLALSVAYANELAALCEETGADATEVARGLRTESRIGPGAYLGPGPAFAGGTLARDVVFLGGLGRRSGRATGVIDAIKPSNDRHRSWIFDRLVTELGGLDGRTVAVWGLAYKAGTDTLRRSSAVELALRIVEAGGRVQAWDPAVTALGELARPGFTLAPSALDAVAGADAVVVATAWPALREIDPAAARAAMRGNVVVDQGRFLADGFSASGVRYLAVGVRQA